MAVPTYVTMDSDSDLTKSDSDSNVKSLSLEKLSRSGLTPLSLKKLFFFREPLSSKSFSSRISSSNVDPCRRSSRKLPSWKPQNTLSPAYAITQNGLSQSFSGMSPLCFGDVGSFDVS